MIRSPCEICEGFERNIQQAYEELAEAKTESKEAGDEVEKRLNRLLSAKHSHQAKQGCLRQGC